MYHIKCTNNMAWVFTKNNFCILVNCIFFYWIGYQKVNTISLYITPKRKTIGNRINKKISKQCFFISPKLPFERDKSKMMVLYYNGKTRAFDS